MKKLNLALLTFGSMFVFLLSSCGDATKTESSNTSGEAEHTSIAAAPEIVFENSYATVAHVKLAPGEMLPEHDGANRVIYSLTDYSIDWEEQGEKLGIKTWKKGDVHFHEAGNHSATNNGKTTAEWLVFARKNSDLPDCGENTVENDVNSVSPEFSQNLFDNDNFRVTRVKLPVRQSIPTHSGVNRIIYSLSDYIINYESDTEGKKDKQFKAGDVHWHEACMHSVANAGETEAEFLVVSYK